MLAKQKGREKREERERKKKKNHVRKYKFT